MRIVMFRGLLYFLIAFLPELLLGLPNANDGKALVIVALKGLLSGCIATRAYVDGSYQRYMDKTEINPVGGSK
jgi:uncharacterized protein (DUF1501 family)